MSSMWHSHVQPKKQLHAHVKEICSTRMPGSALIPFFGGV